MSFYQKYGKRICDLCLAALLLLFFAPFFLIISILVWINIGSPIFFKQPRPGRYGNIFILYKFRTMNEKRDSTGKLLPDVERMTRFGYFLRKSSLDELPEFWNILKGEMSFIGPRPLLVEYLDRYSKEEHQRHELLPGLTGWAQINGRNFLSWDERLEYDLYYVKHFSFGLDMKIFFLTIIKVIKREGTF